MSFLRRNFGRPDENLLCILTVFPKRHALYILDRIYKTRECGKSKLREKLSFNKSLMYRHTIKYSAISLL